MTQQKESKMGLGFIIGIILGAIGGLFLAPKSGKENRDAAAKKFEEMKGMIESGEAQEKIEKIFGDLSDESVRMYNNVREEVIDRVEKMKNMNADDYAAMVQETIEKVKETGKMGAEQVKKMKDQFIQDYPDVKEEVDEKSKKLIAKKKQTIN
ncbi:MAG: hypothetical protein ABIO02_00300 [Patescibacteria group bacterium]